MPSNASPVWLEVALNGAAGRQFQPKIPITPEEIIAEGVACAELGAAILHMHAYDADGAPTEDAEIYERIIEGIREKCDAIVYPTLALHGELAERMAPLEALAAKGLLEMGVVDPGSVNLTHRLQVTGDVGGFVYQNPDAHIKRGLEHAQAEGWRPAYAIYEPGFARLGAAWAEKYPQLKTPVYRFMVSDHLLFGLSPSVEAIDFYHWHISATAPGAPWMLSALDADITGVMDRALELGAHLRVGLEDAPFGSELGNVDLVEHALQRISASGRGLATPADIRAAG